MELKNLQIKRINAGHVKGFRWPVEKKIEVVTKWLALGNLRLVAELTGVSYGIIRLWKLEPWWADLVAEIRSSRDIQVDNKLSKIVDKALETVSDRLENGDIKYNRKTGLVYREPIQAITAHKIGNDLISRQIDISQKRVVETAEKKTEKIEDTLRLLALEFAKFNTKRTIDVVAKEITDAVYDQREAGLQERESFVRLQTRSKEEESGEERSSERTYETGSGTQGGWDGRGSSDSSEQGWLDEDDEFESEDSSFQQIVPAQ